MLLSYCCYPTVQCPYSPTLISVFLVPCSFSQFHPFSCSQATLVLFPLQQPLQQRPHRTESDRCSAEKILVICSTRPRVYQVPRSKNTLMGHMCYDSYIFWVSFGTWLTLLPLPNTCMRCVYVCVCVYVCACVCCMCSCMCVCVSIQRKTTKRHHCDNIEYHDILTHDNRHQLFLISPIPTYKYTSAPQPPLLR